MAKTVNKIMEISNEMTYSIPPSTTDQLLLLPDDNACFTPNTSSIISSALSFDYDDNDNDEHWKIFNPIKKAEISVIKRTGNTGNDIAINSGNETIEKSNNCELDNEMMNDSKSAYSLFETEYDIRTANRYKFPDWSWFNHSRTESSLPIASKTSSSFYHQLDMNIEPVDNMTYKLHIPSQYQLEELRDFAPYANAPNAERTPTVPYLPHTLTRSEYINDKINNSA
uniref:Uncharacterized protein n=1 Tax=Onchocerca volvulus TaxID=6282 RepID=A0A2K6WEZ4_ONCVO